jgi:hypothetical protein
MFTRCTAEAGDGVKNLINVAQVFPKLAPLGGSTAVANAEKDSEQGLELVAFSEQGDGAVEGVVGAVVAVADDATDHWKRGMVTLSTVIY